MTPNTNDNLNNPNEHLNIPKWINEDYFKDLLAKDTPNFSKIIRFTPVAATAPGENYTSIMVRVLIGLELNDGTVKNKSYILKTCLESGNEGSEFVSSMNLFPKEVRMYQTILLGYEQLYKAAGVDIKFGPKCLHVEETPERTTLIMEDLKQWNFINMDRLNGLDMKHTKEILLKLAELHAASAVYEELNGPFDKMFSSSFFTEENRPLFTAIAQSHQAVMIKAMRTWDLENVESFIARLPEPDLAFEEGLRVNTANPNDFNVLNHGDCWTNNFMYSHKENGDINETLLVDFQVAHWGSPAQDLWYFILSSTNENIRVKYFDYFIYIYHKRLVECLKLLKYSKNIPSLKELHIALLKNSYWSSTVATTIMPAILYPSDKDANMENFLKGGPEGDALRYKTQTSPYYVKAMEQIFPFLDYKGVFDLC